MSCVPARERRARFFVPKLIAFPAWRAPGVAEAASVKSASVKSGSLKTAIAIAACFASGCSILPQSQTIQLSKPIVERDQLAEAARAVQTAPWPTPERISFLARVSGAGDKDRVTEKDAILAYVDALQPTGAPFRTLVTDALENLSAAQSFEAVALSAIAAPRVTMNDVAVIERAIQTLRQNREMYSRAVDELENRGVAVDEIQLGLIRDGYREEIKGLGDVADMMADRVARDKTKTYADDEPDHRHRSNLTGQI